MSDPHTLAIAAVDAIRSMTTVYADAGQQRELEIAAVERAIAGIGSPPDGERETDAYRQKNAEMGWTGRAFGFDNGTLHLDGDGNGRLTFDDNKLAWVVEDDAKPFRQLLLPAEELLAIRDYLNQCFPTPPKGAV